MKRTRNPDWFAYVLMTALLVGPLCYAVGVSLGKGAAHEVHRDVMRKISLPHGCETMIDDAWEDWQAAQAARHDRPDPR